MILLILSLYNYCTYYILCPLFFKYKIFFIIFFYNANKIFFSSSIFYIFLDIFLIYFSLQHISKCLKYPYLFYFHLLFQSSSRFFSYRSKPYSFSLNIQGCLFIIEGATLTPSNTSFHKLNSLQISFIFYHNFFYFLNKLSYSSGYQ